VGDKRHVNFKKYFCDTKTVKKTKFVKASSTALFVSRSSSSSSSNNNNRTQYTAAMCWTQRAVEIRMSNVAPGMTDLTARRYLVAGTDEQSY